METEQSDQFLDRKNFVTTLSQPQCCDYDPDEEHHKHGVVLDGSQQLSLIPPVPKDPTIFTVSTIAFNFDFTTSNSSQSRADEIRVLLVKNKKPPRRSKERKPPGYGLPTGQLDQDEKMDHAFERETCQESGYSVTKVVGKLFVVHKRLRIEGEIVPNEIHVFLVKTNDYPVKVVEVDEIDASVEPWISLRDIFKMPFAQDRGGGSKNPDGIYFSHIQRLYRAIESMVYNPEEELVDGVVIKRWLEPNRRHLKAAMADLAKAGLLKNFLPPEEPPEINTSPTYTG